MASECYWDDESAPVSQPTNGGNLLPEWRRPNDYFPNNNMNCNWREKEQTESRYQNRGKSNYSSRDGQGGFRSFQSGGGGDKVEMSIQSCHVGKVIGRGGKKIEELQQESGARIKVLRGDSGADTPVVITGSSSACEKAQELINELISEASQYNNDRTSYNGRNDFNSYSRNNSYSQNSFYEHDTSRSAAPQEQTFIDWDALGKQSEEARQRRLASLPPIIKDFYNEDPDVAALRPTEVAKIRANNNNISVMNINGDEKAIPNPITTFEQAFKKYPELLTELRNQEFVSPSPIQCQAWPIILKGHDLIGIAQTGSGKTIAFLFPAMIHIIGQVTPREQRVGPSCLILAPTRELAQQIEQEAKKYRYCDIKCVCVYGGGSRRNQINVVSKGVDIVIATPGRLNDLVASNVINVTGVTYLVLDEADRMLDLGFEPQIRKILIDVRSDRQTVMTSATWTRDIESLASRYMTNPIKVNVGALDLAAVHSVHQEIVFAEDDDRRSILEDFLYSMEPNDKVIVFVDRKCVADDVASDLSIRGINCQSIHGDREQCDREQALDDLKTGYVRILIATDVASRGLDIKDITHIFNMNFPRNIEEYVHRIGRTGRAGRQGTAITIFTRQDWMHAAGLIKILEEASQEVPDELHAMADRYKSWKRKKDAEDAAAGGRRFGRGRPRQY